MRSSTFPFGMALLVGSPLTATTYTVTNTANAGLGSLRQAIDDANNNFGPDVIVFNIPGAGVQTIVPTMPLPALTGMGGVLIDGFTQPGAGPGGAPPATATLLIEIQGTMAGACDGLLIQSDNNQVQGLVINRFQLDGIHIEGSGMFPNPNADFNLVHACFVGTDPSGTLDRGNGTNTAALRAGIHVSNVAFGNATHNTLDANLVSGNWSEGIWIAGPIQPGAVNTNFVTSNRVGTDLGGTQDLGNDHQGIALTEGTTLNQILSNLVSGNDYDGIGLQGFGNFPLPPIQTASNLIAENIVGLDASATSPLPNSMHGITLGTYGLFDWGCTDANTVRENVIAYNGGDGVKVVEVPVDTINADGNRITRNSIWSNLGLGINLGNDLVTLNDTFALDADNGANQELNFPVLTSARHTPAKTTITGTLQIDVSPDLAVVEVFKARLDPLGHGEGEVFLGAVVPAADGSWSFATTQLRPGDLVTATATDPFNNTSEFSLVMTVVRGKVLPKSGTDCGA